MLDKGEHDVLPNSVVVMGSGLKRCGLAPERRFRSQKQKSPDA